MSYFVYRSLTPDLKRIRLIHLLPKGTHASSETSPAQQLSGASPSQPHFPVACTISHVSLHQAPPYFALSYTWGDTARTSQILVGQTPCYITKSLEEALIHLTPEYVPLTLWIDALCIDQNDEAEKTEQVQQMQQIYSRATSVITWLGPATAHSDAAMLWIQRYGSLAYSFGIGTKPELRLQLLLRIFETDPEKPSDPGLKDFLQDLSMQLSSGTSETNSLVMGLSELFTRAYWSRVWVVQELVHGKSVQFVCGNIAVSEELVHHSLRLLRNFGSYERSKAAQDLLSTDSRLGPATLNVRNPINILKIRKDAGPFPLIYLIRFFRFFKSTDPRDRIFALLSFAVDAATMGLQPDYSKSCKEVYIETTRSLVINGFLDILQLCHINKAIPGIPSWVPDFSSISQRMPLQQRAMTRKAVPITTILQPRFSASGDNQGTEASHDLTPVSPTSLLLPTKSVGAVTRVGTVWQENAFGRWLKELRDFSGFSSTTKETDHLWAVWRTAVADQEIRQGAQKPRLSTHELERIHNFLQSLDLAAVDKETLFLLGLGDYAYQLEDTAFSRRPFCTSKGHIGIGPCEMKEGDLLYVLVGADVPYILRPDTQGEFELIGEAYADGIMDGEAMEDDQSIGVISIR